AENPHAVVKGHDHKTFLREAPAIIERNGSRSGIECAAVNPDKHRPFFGGRLRRCPNVQVETVFADLVVRHELVGPWLQFVVDRLDAARTELRALTDTFPGNDRLGFTPPQVANRRRGKRDAFKRGNGRVASGYAGDSASRDLNGLKDRC